MSSKHARLSASGAYRWMACAGSVRLSRGMPSSTSFYAAQGTLAHREAAACLEHGAHLAAWPAGKHVTVDGHLVTVDEEMVRAIEIYLRHVHELAARPGAVLWVEVSLTPALSKLHPSFGGTADALVWLPEEARLHVVDLKYGAGVLVSPVGNPQLRYYGLGGLLDTGEAAREVVATIVQPRTSGEPVESDTFAATDLIDFAADLLDAALLTERPDAPLVPGEHCRWCPAITICPAQDQHQALVMAPEAEIPAALTASELAAALAVVPMVEARCKALREYAYEEAVSGRVPPGWKLVEKRPTRVWNDVEAVTSALADTPAAWTEPALKPPAQVEKALGKKAVQERLGGYISSVSSGLTLVEESDRRPAMTARSLEWFDDLTVKPETED